MDSDTIADISLIIFIIMLCICLLGLCGYMFIGLKSYYIDVQLKERLLYSGDSYAPKVTILG